MGKQFYGQVSNNLLVVKIGQIETYLQGILQDVSNDAGILADFPVCHPLWGGPEALHARRSSWASSMKSRAALDRYFSG